MCIGFAYIYRLVEIIAYISPLAAFVVPSDTMGANSKGESVQISSSSIPLSPLLKECAVFSKRTLPSSSERHQKQTILFWDWKHPSISVVCRQKVRSLNIYVMRFNGNVWLTIFWLWFGSFPNDIIILLLRTWKLWSNLGHNNIL